MRDQFSETVRVQALDDYITQTINYRNDRDFEKYTHWEKSYQFTVYEYLFFNDLILIEGEALEKLKSKAEMTQVSGEQRILNSIWLHAYQVIEQTKYGFGILGESEFVEFRSQIATHINARKIHLVHDKKFFDVKIWQFKETKFINEYHKKFSRELGQQLHQMWLNMRYRNNTKTVG